MNERMRVGIIMAGYSREREISFAGGRTVFDNLNKQLFEPVPIFVDSFGKFYKLKWEYLYKGTIRDFFPPVNYYPSDRFQFYQEQIFDREEAVDFEEIGKQIPIEQLSNEIDFAFLTLHGIGGEDGSVQGLLEWLQIPYSGCGLLGSAIGIDKIVQKKLMEAMGISVNNYLLWRTDEPFPHEQVEANLGYPFVLKNPLQGSSIGTAVVRNKDELKEGIALVTGRTTLSLSQWKTWNEQEQLQWVQKLGDLQQGLGFPLYVIHDGKRILLKNAEELIEWLSRRAHEVDEVKLESWDAPYEVLVEACIEGTEFSVIVISDEEGRPVALPPTEIRKRSEVFDYTSKYLPGRANKITPIDLPLEAIQKITSSAEHLMKQLHFTVYARIDGFITTSGQVYFNDPNTTSGMLPSSFFFHQAAEVGLSPTDFLTYIIFNSLQARIREGRIRNVREKLEALQKNMQEQRLVTSQTKRIAVVLGGYSAERHISVESGRNILEKLQSSGQYEVKPLFLSYGVESEPFSLYEVPLRLIFKDNADDIRGSIEKGGQVHAYVRELIPRLAFLKDYFRIEAGEGIRHVPLKSLKEHFDFVFIAIHGRPGEDGQLQKILEEQGLPYNGSSSEPARLAMDKHACNAFLRAKGFRVAPHYLLKKYDYEAIGSLRLEEAEQRLGYPMIAKPNDEGCSAAVKKIMNREELRLYLDAIFRETTELPKELRESLGLSSWEEFPRKDEVLLETFIGSSDEYRLIEVTVGFVTMIDGQGNRIYEVFSPSETVRSSEILSLEEKFLAGQGQNITPARFSENAIENKRIEQIVRDYVGQVAEALGLEGYARIDAFVRIFTDKRVDVIIIEVNTLPGMTPATCIFHQAALSHLTPFQFIQKIMDYGIQKFFPKDIKF